MAQTLRIIQKTYQMTIFQDEPGGIQDADEVLVAEKVVMTFAHDGDPKQITAESIGLSDDRYPTNDDEGVVVGDYTYSYWLVDEINRLIKTINPYSVLQETDDWLLHELEIRVCSRS